MRKNLPVFPHRRAAALFPVVWIFENLRLATFGRALIKVDRGRDKPGRPGNAGNVN
jgi:hypothetical protein